MKKSQERYITSWGLQQSITHKIPTKERLRLYKHWKEWTVKNMQPCIIWKGVAYKVKIISYKPSARYFKGIDYLWTHDIKE